MTTLTIKTSFDTSLGFYVGKQIVIPEKIAREFHIQDGGECGVMPQLDLKKFRISYRGAIVNLPFKDIDIVMVCKSNLPGVRDLFSSCYSEDYLKILKMAQTSSFNISVISKKLGRSHTNVGIKVRKLEESGLVQKKFAGSSVLVCLTKEGERVLGEISQ